METKDSGTNLARRATNIKAKITFKTKTTSKTMLVIMPDCVIVRLTLEGVKTQCKDADAVPKCGHQFYIIYTLMAAHTRQHDLFPSPHYYTQVLLQKKNEQ